VRRRGVSPSPAAQALLDLLATADALSPAAR
jgi:hypothetical protein